MIGIGEIAKKAYLPILGTRADIELSIASRNQEVVNQVGQQYSIRNKFSTVQELIDSNIDAAFVHTATEAHVEILHQLINAGIHVFVDKPIAYTLHESEEIVSFAQKRGVKLMVGFNRRYAPMYRNVHKEISHFETILMQKNRVETLSNVRSTVFDDFIHVVDTMLYFLGEPKDVTFHAKVEEGLLHYLVVHMIGGKTTGIGMMNRQTGVTDERLEITGNKKKIDVHNLVHTATFLNNVEQHRSFGDWTPILNRRGFVDMIDHFIESVRSGIDIQTSGEKSLKTHQICEMISSQLEKPHTSK